MTAPIRPVEKKYPSIRVETKFPKAIKEAIDAIDQPRISRSPKIKYRLVESGEWVTIRIGKK